MDTVLLNIATVASMQLSINSEMTVSTPNLYVTYKKATADLFSSPVNSTNHTDESTITIPDLCSMLGSTFDCKNTPLVKQVNKILRI